MATFNLVICLCFAGVGFFVVLKLFSWFFFLFGSLNYTYLLLVYHFFSLCLLFYYCLEVLNFNKMEYVRLFFYGLCIWISFKKAFHTPGSERYFIFSLYNTSFPLVLSYWHYFSHVLFLSIRMSVSVLYSVSLLVCPWAQITILITVFF